MLGGVVRLIQVGNNRNDHFRYFLGVRVRLIEVSFKANKGNKSWDFGYCPLNRGFSLDTGFTVISGLLIVGTNTYGSSQIWPNIMFPRSFLPQCHFIALLTKYFWVLCTFKKCIYLFICRFSLHKNIQLWKVEQGLTTQNQLSINEIKKK